MKKILIFLASLLITINAFAVGSPSNAVGSSSLSFLTSSNPIALSLGGTNATLTASNGAIPYSTATAIALLAAGTSGQLFQSGGSGAPAWTTATFPSIATSTGTILRANGTNWVATSSTFSDTYTASSILYSNGANTVTGLATANNGTLITSGTGVPSISSTLPSAVQNNITAISSASNAPSIGGAAKTFVSGAVSISSSSSGTFTPGISFGGGTTGITYNQQSGNYFSQILPSGVRMTNVYGTVWINNKGSSTGNAAITGMPFAFSGNAMITMWPSGVTIGAGNQLFAFGDNAATTASMFIAANASGVTNATNTNFANGNAFYFSGFYLS